LVIVKADAGTHGMRILAGREACEAVGPNRKRRDMTPITHAYASVRAVRRRVQAVSSTKQAPIDHPGCTFDAISRAWSGVRHRDYARISGRES
jgi:hypothetical protein